MTYTEAYDYANIKRKRLLNTTDEALVSKEFLVKAQEAINKQLPAERVVNTSCMEIYEWQCPICREVYGVSKAYPFCPNCGQAIEVRRW